MVTRNNGQQVLRRRPSAGPTFPPNPRSHLVMRNSAPFAAARDPPAIPSCLPLRLATPT
jgi:hypothetical protein